MTDGTPLQFALTPGAVLPLIAVLVSGFLGAYVFGLNPRGSANRSFLWVMLAFVVWDIGEVIQRSFAAGTATDTMLVWARFTWVGIVLVPATLYHLALTYPTKSDWLRRPGALAVLYAPALGWIYLVTATNLIIDGMSLNAFGPSAHVAPTYVYFAPIFFVWMFSSVALFFRAWWQIRKTPSRWMLGVVLAGLVAGTVPAAVTELMWPILSAADTRVGLGSVYTLMWSIFIAYAVLRYRYLVIEPVTEARMVRAPRHRLERGLNHLVLEHGRAVAMGAFRDIVSSTPGLCVTGLAPARVSSHFGLERTPVLWVTSVANSSRTVRPNALDFELVHTVVKFLRENPETAVLLDDLDYLANAAGFDAVARFLKRVTNQASASKGTVIVAAGHGTFTADQVALLRGAVDRFLDVKEAPLSSPSGSDHVLMTINAQDAPVALPLVGARRGLLLTTEHPAKARLRYGERFEIVWVTDHPEPEVQCVRPKALDTEGRRAISNYAAAHAGTDIVLVGLEQLALYVDVRAWLPFVKDSLDLATLHGCRLFLTVAPEAIRSQELAMLARRFDTGVAATLRAPPSSAPTTAAPESRIPYREPSA
jgi:uncharacterized protein DUF835/histidine kinase-like protein